MWPSPRTRRRAGALLAWALAALTAPAHAQGPRIEVAATIAPLHDIVRQVAGGVVDTVLLLPPGASPHTFEPTPSRVRALVGARVLFLIGHGLDDWAATLARGAGVKELVRADRGISLRPAGSDGGAHGHGVDPHYWLAIDHGKAIARTVSAELTRLLPERGPELAGALAQYLRTLDEADAGVRRDLAGLPSRRIATVHGAFAYFAAAYGLEVVAVFEPSPGREPGPRHVQEFQRAIREAGVRALFVEPQLSPDAVRNLARDLGVAVAVLDPLGGVPERERYVDLMRWNARQIASALGGKRP